jgi:predicted DCC family thiol-disulfide oxidoreductase YuxK
VTAADRAVVLFDGVCTLCNGAVQFVIRRDPARRFQFAALGSPAAARILRDVGGPASLPDSLVVVEDGRVYVRSTAALRIARRLRFPWPLLAALVVVPTPIRDAVYDFVARHRYRWFGRKDACMLPPAGARDLFLE